MKLDKEDIKFLNEYDNLEFYFQCNLCNYFISKYGCKAEISIVNQYINTYEYRLILDDLVIEFDAEKSFDLLKGEECLKIISLEESQNVNDELLGKIVGIELEEIEKSYLELFIEIVDKNGVDSLLDACKNKDFAMYPFVEIIRKLIKKPYSKEHYYNAALIGLDLDNWDDYVKYCELGK